MNKEKKLVITLFIVGVSLAVLITFLLIALGGSIFDIIQPYM